MSLSLLPISNSILEALFEIIVSIFGALIFYAVMVHKLLSTPSEDILKILVIGGYIGFCILSPSFVREKLHLHMNHILNYGSRFSSIY